MENKTDLSWLIHFVLQYPTINKYIDDNMVVFEDGSDNVQQLRSIWDWNRRLLSDFANKLAYSGFSISLI